MKDKSDLILNQRKNSIWDGSIFVILAVMVILIPVVFYPYCITIFDPIKDLVFQLLTFTVLALLLLKWVIPGDYSWKKTALDKPILLYVLFASLSLIWSTNVYHSLLTLPVFLAGPILYYVVSQSVKDQKFVDRLLWIVIATGAVMGAYGILQYLGIDFSFWTGNVGRKQVFGLFGNVNYFAEYLILPLSLTIGLLLFRGKVFPRFFLIISFVLMAGALLLTFTRGSYLAVGISIFVLLFLYQRQAISAPDKKYYQKIILWFLVFIIIVLAIIIIPSSLNRSNTPLGQLKDRISIASLTSGSSILRRVATWKFTWMMIKDHPLLGLGLGTYGYHSLKYQAEFFAQEGNRDIYPHGFAVQAHNEYLQIWSELGIIGLLLFLGILFFYYHSVLGYIGKLNDKQSTLVISLTGGVTAVLVDAVFGFPLQLAASWFLFWLFIGITFVQIQIFYMNKEADEAGNIEIPNQKQMSTSEPACLPMGMGLMMKKIGLSLLVIGAMIVLSVFLFRPFMARVYWYHGNQQILQGNPNEAIQIYEKGLKWNPWQGEMYFDIGNLLANRGILQLALEYYHKAERFVDHHHLPQNIAASYIKRGQIDKAVPYLEKAIGYQPNKKEMLPLQLQLGNIFLTLKDYQKAQKYFLVAVNNNPDSAEAYYGLSGAYLNLGKKELTISSLQKVIELAPESRLAGYAGVTLTKIELSATSSSAQESEKKQDSPIPSTDDDK